MWDLSPCATRDMTTHQHMAKGVRVPGNGNWRGPRLGRGLPALTRATWTVNSTPMPTEAMRMTTGMALSLMPISPMMPNSSTAIMARMETWRQCDQ